MGRLAVARRTSVRLRLLVHACTTGVTALTTCQISYNAASMTMPFIAKRVQCCAVTVGSFLCPATVRAAAAAAGLRLIAVSGPEVLNKYIGASEAAVRDLFR